MTIISARDLSRPFLFYGNMKARATAIVALVAALFGTCAATAQTSGQLMNTRENLSIDRILDRFATAEEAVTSTDPVIPPQLDQSQPPPNAGKLRFKFSKAEISGSTVFKSDELSALFAPLVGKTPALAEIYRAAAEIGEKYVAAGYYQPHVILPPQKINNGAVRIEIREFAIDTLVFSVDGKRTSDNQTLNSLAREIVASRPLTLALATGVARRVNQAGFGVRELRPDIARDGRTTIFVDLTTDPNALAAAARGVRIPARLDAERPPADADKISFTLRDVEVTGATIYSGEQLREAAAGLIGQEITLARLFDVTRAITDRYEADGYIKTKVLVPGQVVVDGKVHIVVSEFLVNKVSVELDGKPVPPDSMIQLMADRVVRTRPISAEAITRAALLISDLPGIRIVEVVPPESGGDTAILRVTRTTMSYSVGFNNRGTDTVGPYQIIGTVTENSALGFNERLSITGATTQRPEELRMISASLDLPLTSDGLKLSATVGDTKARPGGSLRIHDATSTGTNVSAKLSYPFIRMPTRNLNGYIQYDQMDSYGSAFPYLPTYMPAVTLDGGTKVRLNNDRQRNARLGASFELLDEYGGFNRMSAQYSRGLRIMSSRMSGISVPNSAFPYGLISLPISNPTGNLGYGKFNADFQRTQSLPAGFSILGGVRAQFTNDQLPAAEKFSFGGADIGRGLQGAVLSGDTGYAFKSELQYNLSVGEPYFQGVQLYAFYDWGRVWNKYATNNAIQVNATAGFGARASFTSWLSGEIEVGRPLIHGYYNKDNVLTREANVFVGMTVGF